LEPSNKVPAEVSRVPHASVNHPGAVHILPIRTPNSAKKIQPIKDCTEGCNFSRFGTLLDSINDTLGNGYVDLPNKIKLETEWKWAGHFITELLNPSGPYKLSLDQLQEIFCPKIWFLPGQDRRPETLQQNLFRNRCLVAALRKRQSWMKIYNIKKRMNALSGTKKK